MRPGNDKNVIGQKIDGHYRTKKKIELSEVNWSDNDKWKLTSDKKKLTSIIICYRIIAFVPNTAPVCLSTDISL